MIISDILSENTQVPRATVYRKIEVPVLFIFGEEETGCNPELIEACFDSISAPVKKLAIIPKAAHSCFYDRPQEFMKVMNEFICGI